MDTRKYEADVHLCEPPRLVAVTDEHEVHTGKKIAFALSEPMPLESPVELRIAAVTRDGLVELSGGDEAGPWIYTNDQEDSIRVVLAAEIDPIERLSADFNSFLSVTCGSLPPRRRDRQNFPLSVAITKETAGAFAAIQDTVRVAIDFGLLGDPTENKTVIILRAIDAHGNRLDIPSLRFSKALGEQFLYLDPSPNLARGHFVQYLRLPEGAYHIDAEIFTFVGHPIVLVEKFELQLVRSESLSVSFDPSQIENDAIEMSFCNDNDGSASLDLLYDKLGRFGAEPLTVEHFKDGRRSISLSSGETELAFPIRFDHDTERLSLRAKLPPGTFASAMRLAHSDPFSEWTEEFLRRIVDEGADEHYKGVVIIYSTAGAFDTAALPLRSHYVAREFARARYLVLFFPMANNFSAGQIEHGLYQFPARQFELVRSKLTNLSAFKSKTFLCSTLCDPQAVMSLDLFKYLDWKIVFEVRDDMEGMQQAGFGKWFNPLYEDRFYRQSDCIICVSETLYDRAVLKGAPPGRTHVIKNGIDAGTLADARAIRSRTLAMRSEAGHVGYFGHMFDGRFDRKLVEQHAAESAHPYHLIGPGLNKDHKFGMLENVRIDDRMTIDLFLRASIRWKVGTLPFIDNRLTLGLDPIKQYLYLALGMRIVSADVQEMRSCPSTWIYYNSASYRTAIEEALTSDLNDDEISLIDEFLDKSTWQERARIQIKIIEELLVDA